MLFQRPVTGRPHRARGPAQISNKYLNEARRMTANQLQTDPVSFRSDVTVSVSGVYIVD